MNSQWQFVFAAYAVTLIGAAAVLYHSWRVMRLAEARAAKLTERAP